MFLLHLKFANNEVLIEKEEILLNVRKRGMNYVQQINTELVDSAGLDTYVPK